VEIAAGLRDRRERPKSEAVERKEEEKEVESSSSLCYRYRLVVGSEVGKVAKSRNEAQFRVAV
jgi:hypothetical protein